MKDQLQNYMDRPGRYNNIDGTVEMFIGLILLGTSLAGFLEASLLSDLPRWKHGVVVFGVMIPVVGFCFWVQRVIKKHITWPRTGYVAFVAFPSDRKAWRAGIMFAGAFIGASSVCLMVFAMRHGAVSLLRIGTVVLWVAAYASWVFFMGREHRWKWLVLVFMAAGLLVIDLIVPGGFRALLRPVNLFVGLVWLISGWATLISYLRHTQPPAPEAE